MNHNNRKYERDDSIEDAEMIREKLDRYMNSKYDILFYNYEKAIHDSNSNFDHSFSHAVWKSTMLFYCQLKDLSNKLEDNERKIEEIRKNIYNKLEENQIMIEEIAKSL